MLGLAVNNCYKIRLAFSSKNKGKSGGARLITNFVIAENSYSLAPFTINRKKKAYLKRNCRNY
jgi:hypothetical protein